MLKNDSKTQFECYSNPELIDLSGYVFMLVPFLLSNYTLFFFFLIMSVVDYKSSISDGGIGMICNILPESLTRLLSFLCPSITSSNSLTL